MNAIEIRGLKKSFKGMYALNGVDMTVPVGSIYGFIGETARVNPLPKSLYADISYPTKAKLNCLEKIIKTQVCA